MTRTTAAAILSQPPKPYVRPSERGSDLEYDRARNTRAAWVDQLPVPDVLSREAYARPLA
jgi:hypothetical protein